MNTKLLSLCVSVTAATIVWIGCSSDSTPSGETTTDAGQDSGVSTTPTDSGGGQQGDASKDAAKDSASGPGKLTGPFVDVGYGAASCPAFTPCGGDEKGVWTVKGGCVKEEIFAEAQAQCPTLGITDVKFQARGSVTADGTNIVQHTEVKFTAKFAVPQTCKQAIGSCAGIETALKLVGKIDTATCADDGAGGCNCDVADTQEQLTDDTYAAGGNTLTTANPVRTFDYCVDAAAKSITYQETTGGPQPAIFVLGK